MSENKELKKGNGQEPETETAEEGVEGYAYCDSHKARCLNNLCCNLVGSNVFLFSFQSHIIPDHVFGLIQIAVLQIFYFQRKPFRRLPMQREQESARS